MARVDWLASTRAHDIAIADRHRPRAVPVHGAVAAGVDRLRLRAVPLHRRVARPDPGAGPAVWLAGALFSLLLASPGGGALSRAKSRIGHPRRELQAPSAGNGPGVSSGLQIGMSC